MGCVAEGGEGVERNLAAVGALDVEVVERVGGALEVGRDLHDDVVLVLLREDGGDLALREGVVEHVVDGRRRDAEARGGVAVDDERGAEAVDLLVAGDVGDDAVESFELVDELVGDLRELDGIGVFDGVLVLRARDAVFDGEVLRGLQEGLDAGDLVELALQALDDLLRGVLAVVAVLEVDLDAAGVERGVGVVDADVAGDARRRRGPRGWRARPAAGGWPWRRTRCSGCPR